MPRYSNVVVPADYEAKHGEHTHLCKSCGTHWAHSNELANDPDITQAEYAVGHQCPDCGREERLKHRQHDDDIDEAVMAFMLSLFDKRDRREGRNI